MHRGMRSEPGLEGPRKTVREVKELEKEQPRHQKTSSWEPSPVQRMRRARSGPQAKDAPETPTLGQGTQGCLIPSSCSEMGGGLHATLLLNPTSMACG